MEDELLTNKTQKIIMMKPTKKPMPKIKTAISKVKPPKIKSLVAKYNTGSGRRIVN
jgi:hypothetical protein